MTRSREQQLLTCAAALLGVCAGALGGTTSVRMRTVAVAAESSSVRVGEIAAVEGELAGEIAVLIVPVEDGLVTLGAVREAVEGAGHGVGEVVFAGSSCVVRAGGDRAAEADGASGGASESAVADDADLFVVASDVLGADTQTVRTVLTEHIVSLHGLPGEDLRLTFDGEDEGFLGIVVDGSVRATVHPGTSASSPRPTFRIDVHREGRLERSERVRVEVLRREVVCRAAARIERGEVIGAEDVIESEEWLEPTGKRYAVLEGILGSEAGTRLDASEVVYVGDVLSPVVARRGDVVMVSAESGGVRVEMKTYARRSERLGELATLRVAESNRRVRAVMTGPGRARKEQGG